MVAHGIWQHVHRLATHTSVRYFRHQPLGFRWFHPVVIGAGGLFIWLRYVSQMFGPRHICGMAPVKIGIGPVTLIQFVEYRLTFNLFLFHAHFHNPVRFFVRAVTPPDSIRLCQFRHFFNPFF